MIETKNVYNDIRFNFRLKNHQTNKENKCVTIWFDKLIIQYE